MLPASTLSMHPSAPITPDSSGGTLVATDGRILPLERTHLAAHACGGIARVTLEQVFRNPHDQPLHVVYRLPLPASGAISGFAFRIGELRIRGEVDRRHSARQRFERAIIEGKAAALLEQQRADLFTQEVGNIPPHAEIVCEVEIDQRLTWLDEGAWEWRFPTVVGPRYMGAAGRVSDVAAISVPVAHGPLDTRTTLALTVEDTVSAGQRPASPSHALRSVERGNAWDVSFSGDRGAVLDRDVIVRWPAARPGVGLALAVARPSSAAHTDRAYGLLTIVPPTPESRPTPMPRDLVFLIDTSGSMGGRPLDQAKHVMCAIIDTLGDRDRLEMIQFSSQPERWRHEPVVATRDGKREAMKWVRALRAGGGTEMRDAILEALRPLRPDSQRQVVLITDGYIGFEQEIVAAILDRLPAQCRVHTIGVGSAPNRSLTAAAARAGAGVELAIALDEDAEPLAKRLLARTSEPLVTELVIEGAAVLDTAPARLPDLFAGAPVLVSLALRPEGGAVRVHGAMAGGARFEQAIDTPAHVLGEGQQAVAALYGRERVEDLEARAAAGAGRIEIDRTIEQLGLDFQVATRLTSWLAVSERVVVEPGSSGNKVAMPHEIPFGVDVEGLGLRQAGVSQGEDAPTGFSQREAMAGGLHEKVRSQGSKRQRTMAAPETPPSPRQIPAGPPASASPVAPEPVLSSIALGAAGPADAARSDVAPTARPAPAPDARPDAALAARPAPAPPKEEAISRIATPAAPSGSPIAGTTGMRQYQRSPRRSLVLWLVFFALVLAVVLGVWWLLGTSSEAGNTQPASSAPAGQAPAGTIAPGSQPR